MLESDCSIFDVSIGKVQSMTVNTYDHLEAKNYKACYLSLLEMFLIIFVL